MLKQDGDSVDGVMGPNAAVALGLFICDRLCWLARNSVDTRGSREL